MMKAIIWTAYGAADGLQLADVPKPTPKDDQVLIRIRATTVTAGDCEARSLKFSPALQVAIRLLFGIRRPRNVILGQELAGEIEAVGKQVTRFTVGDFVFGTPGLRFGAYAEYICLSENAVLAPKPVTMTAEEAATVPVAGMEALHFMRQARIKPGDKMLIIGAGGSIGTSAVQLAQFYGAEVSAVDQGSKLDMLRTLGVKAVIDYTHEDFSTRGESYDIIFDVMGRGSFSGSIRSLKPHGRYLLGNAGLLRTLQGRWISAFSNKQVIVGAAIQKREDLEYLKGLIEAGHFTSVIDRRYTLPEIAEAHRYVDSGQKKGHVVITV